MRKRLRRYGSKVRPKFMPLRMERQPLDTVGWYGQFTYLDLQKLLQRNRIRLCSLIHRLFLRFQYEARWECVSVHAVVTYGTSLACFIERDGTEVVEERKYEGKMRTIRTFPKPAKFVRLNGLDEVFTNDIRGGPWIASFREYDSTKFLFVPFIHRVYVRETDGWSASNGLREIAYHSLYPLWCRYKDPSSRPCD